MKKAMKVLLPLALVAAMVMMMCAAFADAGKMGLINVISREDGSGTRGAFISLLGIEEKGEDGTKKDMTTKEATIANKTDVMLVSVSGDAAAIGYVSLGSLNDTVKAVSVDGVAPSSETIMDGSYPLARPFYIATKGGAEGVTADFIRFMTSGKGQAIVSGSYVVVDAEAPTFETEKPAGKIVVAGSSSVSPLMEKLQEAYLAINDQAEIEIQMSDSTAGMLGAMEGNCDIGMASRELKDEEKAALSATAIAMDGIAVIVHPENASDDLSQEALRQIFRGDVETWADVQQ